MLETDKEYMLELAEELDDLQKIQDGQPIYLTHKERLALHILSDYIKDSTPNETIRNKIKELELERIQVLTIQPSQETYNFVIKTLIELLDENLNVRTTQEIMQELLGDDTNEN